MRFVTWVKLKVHQISDKLVHQGLRYGVSDGTFEAKKDQPKLDIRTMTISIIQSEEVLLNGVTDNQSPNI